MDTQPDDWDVEEILNHRRKKDGTWEFLTQWEGTTSSEATWEPAKKFVINYCRKFVDYLKSHRLDMGVSEVFQASV